MGALRTVWRLDSASAPRRHRLYGAVPLPAVRIYLGRRAHMKSSRGVVTVAYGAEARVCAKEMIASLRAVCDLPICVIAAQPLNIGETHFLVYPDADRGARGAKLSQHHLPFWDQTLYLDADTLVKECPCAPFALLDDGYDLVLAPSLNQGIDTLANVPQPERSTTLGVLGYPDAVTLQCGVLYWRRSPAMRRLWERWRLEWDTWKGQDQGAFLRALAACPVRLWLLGRDYNSPTGAVVEHRFGRAVRRS